MNELIMLQLLGLVDSNLDKLEMSYEDTKYYNNGFIQSAIKKIKLNCLKYALKEDLDSEDLKKEYIIITEDFNADDKRYLDNYTNDLISKMKKVLDGPQYEEKHFDDGTWHWDDEMAPVR